MSKGNGHVCCVWEIKEPIFVCVFVSWRGGDGIQSMLAQRHGAFRIAVSAFWGVVLVGRVLRLVIRVGHVLVVLIGRVVRVVIGRVAAVGRAADVVLFGRVLAGALDLLTSPDLLRVTEVRLHVISWHSQPIEDVPGVAMAFRVKDVVVRVARLVLLHEELGSCEDPHVATRKWRECLACHQLPVHGIPLYSDARGLEGPAGPCAPESGTDLCTGDLDAFPRCLDVLAQVRAMLTHEALSETFPSCRRCHGCRRRCRSLGLLILLEAPRATGFSAARFPLRCHEIDVALKQHAARVILGTHDLHDLRHLCEFVFEVEDRTG